MSSTPRPVPLDAVRDIARSSDPPTRGSIILARGINAACILKDTDWSDEAIYRRSRDELRADVEAAREVAYDVLADAIDAELIDTDLKDKETPDAPA